MFLRKKWMAVTSVLMACVMAFPVLADTQTDINNAQSAKEQQEEDLNAVYGNIEQLETEKNNLQTYLTDLNAQITELDDQLAALENDIAATEITIAETEEAVRNARGDEEDQYDSMKIRIRYMYENSQTSFIASILGAGSLTEMLNNLEEVRAIEKSDRQSLQRYKEAREAVEKKELELLEEKASLEDLKAEQIEKQAAVQALADETSVKIDEYLDLIDTEQANADSLRAEIAASNERIEALQAKKAAEEEAARKAAEEEARRIAAEKKAAEEAAKKAAEEAARNEAINGSGSTSSDDSIYASVGSFNYSQKELELLWAIVAQEDDKSYTGALAVVSCAMNRAIKNYGGHGTDPLSQLKAPGQFCYSPSISASSYWQRRLNGNVPSHVKQAVADCLQNGIRNHNFIYFRSRAAAGRTQIGGNWYF